MKDSYYFQHDSNARNDPKIKALIKKYGMEGYGRFWVIIEMMRESSNYKLDDRPYIWNALAEYMHVSVEDVKGFLKDCVNEFDLLIQEDGFIYSQSLLTRMNKLDEIRAKRKYAAECRWSEDE